MAARDNWLSYEPFKVDVFNDMPDWMFKPQFKTFEEVGGQVQASQMNAQKLREAEEAAATKAKKRKEDQELLEILRGDPDLVRVGNEAKLDEELLGHLLRTGDVEGALKQAENRSKQALEREKAARDAAGKRDIRSAGGDLVEITKDGSARVIYRSPDAPKEGPKGKVVQYVTPEGATVTRIIRTPEEEFALLTQGYEELTSDPLKRQIQMGQKKKQAAAAAPKAPSGPGFLSEAERVISDAYNALGNFGSRNAPPPKKRRVIGKRMG